MPIVPKDQIVTLKRMFSNDGFLITWGYVFYEYLISLAYGAVDMTGGSNRQAVAWKRVIVITEVALPLYSVASAG